MPLPSDDAIDTAILWLESNEGAEGERERCRVVAAWLDEMMQGRALRAAARDSGVSVKAVRTLLRRKP